MQHCAARAKRPHITIPLTLAWQGGCADTRSLEYAVTGRYRARYMVPRLVASSLFLLLFVLAAYFGE